MARPSKLSSETTERITGLIRAGNTVEVAAGACGISEATFYVWMGRPEPRYVAFAEAVEQARAEAEATLVTRIAKAAANGSWQAAGWLLERRYSERWAKPFVKKDGEELKDATDPFAALDELSARRQDRSQTA